MVVKKKSESWREHEREINRTCVPSRREDIMLGIASLPHYPISHLRQWLRTSNDIRVSLLPDFTFYYSFFYQSLSFLCFTFTLRPGGETRRLIIPLYSRFTLPLCRPAGLSTWPSRPTTSSLGTAEQKHKER